MVIKGPDRRGSTARNLGLLTVEIKHETLSLDRGT
jgi:hypothetical protein